MNKIIEILIERDNMSLEEAKDLYNLTRREINEVLEDGDISSVEDIMYYNLGLELDYIHYII